MSTLTTLNSNLSSITLNVAGCQTELLMVGCVLRLIDSEVIYRQHPHLLSLARDVKLGFYTVPTGNRTPGRHVAVHYTTAAPHLLRCY